MVVSEEIDMKVREIKKSDAAIRRGLVMMDVQAPQDVVDAFEVVMKGLGYPSTSCQEEGDKDGEVSLTWMITREDVSYFRAQWAQFKKTL